MEPQTITIEFTVEHKPGTEGHLRSIVENYLRSKGVPVIDGKIVL